MDILIRGIDKSVVKELDQVAKKKHMSRNDYLKIVINNAGTLDVLKSERNRFALSLDKASEAASLNHKRLESLEEGYKKLSTLIALSTGISLDEVDKVFLEDGFDMSVFK